MTEKERVNCNAMHCEPEFVSGPCLLELGVAYKSAHSLYLTLFFFGVGLLSYSMYVCVAPTFQQIASKGMREKEREREKERQSQWVSALHGGCVSQSFIGTRTRQATTL